MDFTVTAKKVVGYPDVAILFDSPYVRMLAYLNIKKVPKFLNFLRKSKDAEDPEELNFNHMTFVSRPGREYQDIYHGDLHIKVTQETFDRIILALEPLL